MTSRLFADGFKPLGIFFGDPMGILVSAPLVGINCSYNGDNSLTDKALILVKSEGMVPVCPEQLGGLAAPRAPAEMARLCEIPKALLKQNSPSCGYGQICRGNWVVKGDGVTAAPFETGGD